MSLFEEATRPLRKYADFKGRASRAEFWLFFFFVLFAQAGARIVDAILGHGGFLPGPVAALVGLLLIVPQLAVTVRRLHDVGRSGRELIAPAILLLAAPIVAMFGSFLGRIVALGYAGITLLVFANLVLLLIKEGRNVPNRYGANPKAFSFGG